MSATSAAGDAQMLTMPVATCSVYVSARAGSTNAESAAGEPPTQTAP